MNGSPGKEISRANAVDLDKLLPFVLRRDNVARYEDGVVWIGDRRKYPFEEVFYKCEEVEEVAWAIENMVTQGGGPWVAAAFGLALAARQAEEKDLPSARSHLQEAVQRLTQTRPTNTAMARRLQKALQVSLEALQAGRSPETAVLEWVKARRDEAYRSYAVRSRLGADLIKDGDGILTMCFAETAFILAVSMAREDGKQIRVYTPETRPYLQGARLTAPSLKELEIPVTIITDNMPAHLMAEGKIHKYFTAADLITMDGHVVNKIGTFQNALAAAYHQIPYFAFMWGVDYQSPDRSSVEIEIRDPREIKSCRGQLTTREDIEAYYPAFDITPPHLVAGVITVHGVLSPYDLRNHFLEPDKE